MSAVQAWLASLLATDAPALPAAWAMQLGLTLGWAVVLALLAVLAGCRWSRAVRRVLAVAVVLWTLVPGPVSPDYWLGLAFHAPSLSATLLSLWLLGRSLTGRGAVRSSAPQTRSFGGTWLLLAVVALGYGLLLDTFAVLPVQMYAWGFSPALLLGLLALVLLPWLLRGSATAGLGPELWVAPVALLLFAITRLPTGNVWDALLDPWLWLLLQGVLLRRLYLRWRG